MFRTVACAGVLGGFGWLMMPSGYSRTVDRPPAEVAAAIADLDIRDAPGSPGTDPMASGGELPTFTVESASDHVSYVVTAHGEVALRMTAWLRPVDGGRRTEVTASVERGPAPDDYVSPVFRSKGISLGLFSAMLEDQLDDLVFKIGRWGPHCDAVMAKFEARNLTNGSMNRPNGLTEAFAGTAKAVMSISALDKELKAAGCPQNANGDAPQDADGFIEVRDTMSEGSAERPPPFPPRLKGAEPVPGIGRVPEAARPTVDLTKYQ